MAHKTILSIVILAILTLPADGKDKRNANAQPLPVKQQAVQLRVQPGAFAVRGAQSGSINLIRIPKVQDELKLDEDQKAKVQDTLQTANAERQEWFGALRILKGEERQKKLKEIQNNLKEQATETEKQVRQALKPEQTQRLDQIALQQRGIRALSDEKVAKKLDLKDEQKNKIQDAEASLQTKRTQLMQDIRNGNVERAKLREKLNEINEAQETETMDALTDEQKAQFEKMKGAKFEFPQRGGLRIQAVPLQIQPGNIKRIQIQPQQIQRNGGKIKIRIQAVPQEE